MTSTGTGMRTWERRCVYCGRKGTRAFVWRPGTGSGPERSGWVCTNVDTCVERHQKTKGERRRVIYVAGVRFESRDGHYISECGRWGVYHMLRDTTNSCWELWRAEGDNRWGDLIDDALTLGEIVLHAQRGRFTLEKEG